MKIKSWLKTGPFAHRNWDQACQAFCYQVTAKFGTSHLTYLSGPDPRFEDLPTCADIEPVPGQQVHDGPIEGDGTTDSGATQFGYQPGSMTLTVNGVDWTDQVTEVSPPAGTYTVAYPFPLGSVVLFRYRSD